MDEGTHVPLQDAAQEGQQCPQGVVGVVSSGEVKGRHQVVEDSWMGGKKLTPTSLCIYMYIV